MLSLQSIPAPSRGLEIEEAKVTFELDAAFDGTPTELALKLYAGGSLIGWYDIPATTVEATAVTRNLSDDGTDKVALTDTPVIGDTDAVVAKLDVEHAADGTAVGTVRIHSVHIKWRESRA